jgi:hypothetical protein
MKKRRIKLWEDAPAQPTASEPAVKADLDKIFADLTKGLDEEPSEEEIQQLADNLRREGNVDAAALIEAETEE